MRPAVEVRAIPPKSVRIPPARPRPEVESIYKIPARPDSPAKLRRDEEPTRSVVAPFVMEDGVAVTMGDLVIGVPEEPGPGRAAVPAPRRWPGSVLAYFIQPDLPRPERIHQALGLFAGTPLRFVEYTNERDALVFVPGTGACKSYLGRKGGHQPIWLSAGCGPTEIAHEILHALGFVHEQNRADRDRFVRVHEENIEPGFEINFTKLPPAFMGLNGLSPFDPRSILIYPKSAFGVGGRDTLESVDPRSDVAPMDQLSEGDLGRLRAAFTR